MPEVGVSTPQAFRDWDERQGTVTPASQDRSPGTPTGNRKQGTEGVRLTSPAQPDRLEELSHVYATVLRDCPSDFGFIPETELTPDTSGIVRGSEESDTRNDLAGNTLLALVRTGIENDFESVVFPQYPLLREIKRLLMGTPAGVSSGTPVDSSGNAIHAALSGQAPLCLGFTGPRQTQGRLNNAFRLPAARPSLRRPCPDQSTGAECSQSDDCRQGTPATVLGDRLTVGQVPFCRLRRAAIGGMRRGRQVERCCIGRSTNGRSSAFLPIAASRNRGHEKRAAGRTVLYWAID